MDVMAYVLDLVKWDCLEIKVCCLINILKLIKTKQCKFKEWMKQQEWIKNRILELFNVNPMLDGYLMQIYEIYYEKQFMQPMRIKISINEQPEQLSDVEDEFNQFQLDIKRKSINSSPFNNDDISLFIPTCKKLLNRLAEHPEAIPFRYPVDIKTPFYYNIITNPIDLSTIEYKLNHYKTVGDFISDIVLMFDNCFVFNDPGSIVYEKGLKLQRYFSKECRRSLSNVEIPARVEEDGKQVQQLIDFIRQYGEMGEGGDKSKEGEGSVVRRVGEGTATVDTTIAYSPTNSISTYAPSTSMSTLNNSLQISELMALANDLCYHIPEYPLPEESIKTIIAIPNSTTKISEKALSILDQLSLIPESEIFKYPVDKRVYNYYKVIKQPMDLFTIECKALCCKYLNLHQLMFDFELIFKNCFTFNTPDSLFYKKGESLLNLFNENITTWLEVEGGKGEGEGEGEEGLGVEGDEEKQEWLETEKLFLQISKQLIPKPKKKLLDLFLEILDKIKSQKISIDFLYPVDPIALNIPIYFNKIKRPMDISKIESKLNIYKNFKHFDSDVSLIFKNCQLFNQKGSLVYQNSIQLEKIYEKCLIRVKSLFQQDLVIGDYNESEHDRNFRIQIENEEIKPTINESHKIDESSTLIESPIINQSPIIADSDRVIESPSISLTSAAPLEAYSNGWSGRFPKSFNLNQAKSLLSLLKDHPLGYHFLEPVDPVALNIPNYFHLIKRPMDFSTIESNLSNYSSTFDFILDVQQVFVNCFIYNNQDSSIYTEALELLNVFETQVAGWLTPWPHTRMDPEEIIVCHNLIEKCKKQPFAFPFLDPVDAILYSIPKYYDIIRMPMDLKTLAGRNEKYATIDDFIFDFKLMIKNAYTFNLDDSEVFVMAKKLDAFYEKEWPRLVSCLPLKKPQHPIPRDLKHRLVQLIQGIRQEVFAFPFNEPVDYKQLKLFNYPKIIKQPMDLSTIHAKLQQDFYENVGQVLSDFKLVIDNCIRFNGEDAPVSRSAVVLEKAWWNIVEKNRDVFGDVVMSEVKVPGQTVTYAMLKSKTRVKPF
ncbi:Bromodomain-containing protein [Rozella allomycis CSF55]|uniref:Bromodomain-containing protein n=1 Tax=Rozella allomycis (strain CSF55) TaxID=988480 RepID=A0A4P9YDH9_ROZAC|nr:Bromodomain-containing protein [Rozella allomycis CSF55]